MTKWRMRGFVFGECKENGSDAYRAEPQAFDSRSGGVLLAICMLILIAALAIGGIDYFTGRFGIVSRLISDPAKEGDVSPAETAANRQEGGRTTAESSAGTSQLEASEGESRPRQSAKAPEGVAGVSGTSAPEVKQASTIQDQESISDPRYEQLKRKYALQFDMPQVGASTKLTLASGDVFRGTLISLDESEVWLKLLSGGKVGFSREQLDQRTRIKFFREDYASASARAVIEQDMASSQQEIF